MAGQSLRQAGLVFKKAMRLSYDNLGFMAAVSSVWFTLVALPVGFLTSLSINVPGVISLLVVAFALIFWGGPGTVALYGVVNQLINDEYTGVAQMWPNLRAHYKLATQVTAVMLAILLVLFIDIVVFLQSKFSLLHWISVFWVYFIAFWLLMSTYVYPLVVHQRVGLLKVLQRAALLTLDNMVVTLALILEIILVTILCWFFLLPVVIYMGGAIALLQLMALKVILTKYNHNEQVVESEAETR